mgnify:CR=1 FL=1
MEKSLTKIVILLFIVVNIYATDLVDLYRSKGLSAVEQKLEDSLKDKNYWDNYLKDKNIELGYYEAKKYIIVTQKEIGELTLYEKENNDFKLLSRNNVIVGENEGDKYLEGDKKTPEGAYDLVDMKTQLDPFYGPFALVTSYPNVFDKTLDKKGHGIWIHGMPLNEDREKFTKGCIALDNPQLEEMASKIDLEKAILLTSQGEFEKASKNDIALILSTIYKWKDSWKKSDIDEYLKFYSPNFKKDDGSNFEEFSDYKKRVFSKNERKRIKFTNIDISPYPNSLNKKMYKVLMDEDYLSPSVKFKGKKELFLEVVNEQIQILAEG